MRLSDEEKRLVDDAAATAGLTPTGYAAKAAVAAASRAARPGSTDVEELKDLQRELFAARRAVNMFGSNVNQAAATRNSAGSAPVWVADAVRLCAAAVARLDEVTTLIHRMLR